MGIVLCRVVARSQEFEPFGVAEVGSAERAAYIRHLQGYLAATLLPIFESWAGDMPAHLQKARPCLHLDYRPLNYPVCMPPPTGLLLSAPATCLARQHMNMPALSDAAPARVDCQLLGPARLCLSCLHG